MRHRSVAHNFMLLPAEQAQWLVSFVSGTKREADSTLLLSSASSLSHANEKTHQSGQHRLGLGSSFPSENEGLPWSGVYSHPRASLRGLWSEYSYDALPGTLKHTMFLQGLPQGTPSPKGTHLQSVQLYPWLSLGLLGSL